MRIRRNACRILVGKSTGKHPLGRPKWTWENKIKTNLKKTGCEVGRWMELVQVVSNGDVGFCGVKRCQCPWTSIFERYLFYQHF
jgi:hypothetical protein